VRIPEKKNFVAPGHEPPPDVSDPVHHTDLSGPEDANRSVAAAAPRFRSVLLICAANTARSVMAEQIIFRELQERGFDDEIQVRSAGIAPYARDGALVSLDTRMALRDIGIHLGDDATSTDLKRHPELLHEADLVIAMTEQQARELRQRFTVPAHLEVHTLRSFAGEAGDIDDPFEKGDLVFAQCREEIMRLIPRVIDRLFGVD
jgi:protein-tyrosine-phosphatase